SRHRNATCACYNLGSATLGRPALARERTPFLRQEFLRFDRTYETELDPNRARSGGVSEPQHRFTLQGVGCEAVLAAALNRLVEPLATCCTAPGRGAIAGFPAGGPLAAVLAATAGALVGLSADVLESAKLALCIETADARLST